MRLAIGSERKEMPSDFYEYVTHSQFCAYQQSKGRSNCSCQRKQVVETLEAVVRQSRDNPQLKQ